MGGLLEGQRDAGGLMYMRNRYYDPKIGQFTQPDPIGIAGGLNTYGFADADPVSYADSYGLCPESLRISGDRCPGGLTDEQWNSAHEGAETLVSAERTVMFEKLAGGGISAADLGSSKLAHTVWSPDGEHDQIVLNTHPGSSFFEVRAPGDRGWVLSHERGHELQNGGTQAERDLLWAVTKEPYLPGAAGAVSRAFARSLEHNADAHACVNSSPVVWSFTC
jgi:RHS repeat-associated protein